MGFGTALALCFRCSPHHGGRLETGRRGGQRDATPDASAGTGGSPSLREQGAQKGGDDDADGDTYRIRRLGSPRTRPLRDGAASGRSWAAVLARVLLLGLAVPARAEGPSPRFRLYDDFSRRLLDPVRWLSSSACGPTSLECTREIREDALALRVRAYGELGLDSDNQFASSALALLKDASATAIAARLQVRATSAAGCPGYSDDAHGQALIAGTFFNGDERQQPRR